MKYTLLAFCMAAGFAATAQHHDNSYNYSVFSSYKDIPPVNAAAMMHTQEKVNTVFPAWNVNVDKLTNNFKDIYGDAIAIPGNTLEEKVAYCMDHKLSQLGVSKAEWKQTRNTRAAHASYIDFAQQINGHDVVFSNLSFRFTTDGRLVRVKTTSYGKPASNTPALLDKATILSMAGFTRDITGAKLEAATLSDDWSWFPVPGVKGYELRPAYEFTFNGTAANNFPMEITGYVDAATGEMLYRTNHVHDIFNVSVASDSIYKENRTMPVSTEPLANLRLDIGSNSYNTNDTGWYFNNSLNIPQTIDIPLRGRWARVRTNGGATPSYTATFNTNDSTYIFPADNGSTIRHVNAYYHVNTAHDFMKSKFGPSFTGLDVEATVNVEVPGTCNAFYSNGNTSLNFFPPGGGCNSFAEIGDVVYHEYGHGICYKFYTSQGANFSNGSMGEGYADVWGMSITKDSVLGRYRTINNPASYVRRYDQAPKVYPVDINGEVHNDGEIIAGSWYYIARYTGSFETMTDLFVKTHYDVPNGPNGAEGDLYHDVLISAILNDDDDAALSNGTPHLEIIVRAFAEHGIYIMSGATLTHTELEHQPSNTPITVNASLSISEASFFQDMKLFYRHRGTGTWDSTSMTNTGNFNFTGQLPGFPSFGLIDYYFKVYDMAGNSTYGFPNGYNTTMVPTQVTIPYQFAVGVKKTTVIDFETAPDGWLIGNNSGDNATAGEWERAKPNATTYSSLVVQTGADHTTGSGQCLVTGSAGGNYNSDDVDNGTTTVITPVFDLGAFTFPVVEYYRWFSNDRGSNGRSDNWVVQIKDDTSPLWTSVENTYQSDHNWRRRVFNVREYLPYSRYIQMKFVAKDQVQSGLQNDGQNCIEAAVDDFTIYDLALSDLGTAQYAKESRVEVYPNPAHDRLAIKLDGTQTGVITLADVTGKTIATQLVEKGNTHLSFNTSGIAAGQYMLTVRTNNISEVKKVTIAH